MFVLLFYEVVHTKLQILSLNSCTFNKKTKGYNDYYECSLLLISGEV